MSVEDMNTDILISNNNRLIINITYIHTYSSMPPKSFRMNDMLIINNDIIKGFKSVIRGKNENMHN